MIPVGPIDQEQCVRNQRATGRLLDIPGGCFPIVRLKVDPWVVTGAEDLLPGPVPEVDLPVVIGRSYKKFRFYHAVGIQSAFKSLYLPGTCNSSKIQCGTTVSLRPLETRLWYG